MYIPFLKVGIEYDGSYFHSDPTVLKKDREKNEFLKSHGVKLIRIRESKCGRIGNVYKKIFIDENASFEKIDEMVIELLEILENEKKITESQHEKIQHLKTIVNTERDQMKIFSSFKRNEKSNSLLKKRPDIAAFWDQKKNGNLTTSEVSYKSSLVVNWKCRKKHSWKTTVNAMSSKPRSLHKCPFCNDYKLHRMNSLVFERPDIAAFWDFDRNKKFPWQFKYNSSSNVHFRCKKGHRWKTTIVSMTKKAKNAEKCPFCNGRRVSLENSLGVLQPAISLEWHNVKNGDLTPFEVTEKSSKRVWWKCRVCSHEYESIIFNQVKEKKTSSCSECRKQIRSKKVG